MRDPFGQRAAGAAASLRIGLTRPSQGLELRARRQLDATRRLGAAFARHPFALAEAFPAPVFAALEVQEGSEGEEASAVVAEGLQASREAASRKARW